MTGGRWLATARASHTRAMAAPQNFPLFGDGAETRLAQMRGQAIDSDSGMTGAALAEARYRDWYSGRATGALDAVARAGAYEPPPLALLPDDAPAAIQTRLAIPPRRPADAAARLARAEAIIAALAGEFAELFPDELAAAVRFLADSR